MQFYQDYLNKKSYYPLSAGFNLPSNELVFIMTDMENNLGYRKHVINL